MKIIVIGSGTVGAAICAQLVAEKHDVTVVDQDGAALSELSNVCDVFGIEGNGANVDVLRKAGAANCDLLIAVTRHDELNILACAVARKLGTRHTVARVRNPEYTGLMKLMKNDMNLSMTINPELTVAKEIYRMLRFPAAAKINTFYRGRVEMAEFTVAEGSPIVGATLFDLRSKLNMKFLVCAVLRGDKVFIPSGNFTLLAGDMIAVTVSEENLTAFFKAIGAYKRPVGDVLIVGGGRTTYYLESMMKRGGIRSTVIEKNPDLCRALAEEFSCTVICGNGTKQELLLEEGIERTDAFLALSEDDEENAVVSMYAHTKNVKKVVTMISAMPYMEFFKGIGLDSVVSPRSSTAADILRYVRATVNNDDSDVESLHRFMDDRVEAIEFFLGGEIDGITGIPLKQLRPRAGVLIACIIHDDEILIPSGDDTLSGGDSVIVVTTGGQINSIKDIL